MTTKTVTVRYFAAIREALGTGSERVSTAAPRWRRCSRRRRNMT